MRAHTLTFIHFSDFHLGAFGPDGPDLLPDTRASLAVAEVRRLSPAPSFAVVSGDLSNRGDPQGDRAVGFVQASFDRAEPSLRTAAELPDPPA